MMHIVLVESTHSHGLHTFREHQGGLKDSERKVCPNLDTRWIQDCLESIPDYANGPTKRDIWALSGPQLFVEC
jgi:hypothetical protein